MLSLFVLALLTYAHSKRCTIAAVALAYALPRFGLLVGVGIALALGVEEMPDFTEATAVAFFLLYVVLMAIWVANYHERKQVEQRAHAAREEAAAAMSRAREAEEKLHEMSEEQHDAYHACCDALAKQHGLTEREKSILVLLAQGRDISFIADALFLSKNTVKSLSENDLCQDGRAFEAGHHRPGAGFPRALTAACCCALQVRVPAGRSHVAGRPMPIPIAYGA